MLVKVDNTLQLQYQAPLSIVNGVIKNLVLVNFFLHLNRDKPADLTLQRALKLLVPGKEQCYEIVAA